jgi:hypothetical protein
MELIEEASNTNRCQAQDEVRMRRKEIPTGRVLSPEDLSPSEKTELKTMLSNYLREPHGGHRSPRPHMRSAHAHLYWTGEARGVPVVKYLPPIPVKGGTTMDDRIVDVR